MEMKVQSGFIVGEQRKTNDDVGVVRPLFSVMAPGDIACEPFPIPAITVNHPITITHIDQSPRPIFTEAETEH